VIALISNLAFKAATVAALGARRLWKMAVLPFMLTMAVGIAIVVLWH
jgi:hypothetical protein